MQYTHRVSQSEAELRRKEAQKLGLLHPHWKRS